MVDQRGAGPAERPRMSQQVVIHTSKQPISNPATLLRTLWREMIGSRHVAYQMMTRDLRSQYRTSVVGVLIPLLPALTTAAWAILFRDAHLINVGAINMPYPFFVLCGMMLWAAFLESMDAPISGVQAEQALLSKANIPPEAVTLARLGQVLVNFGVKALLIGIAAVLYRVHVPWTIVFAPVGLALIVALGMAIGLILAPINLLYTDIAKALPIVTTFWFFTTPIIFTSPAQGWAAILMKRVNPMTPLLTTTRELAFGGGLSMPRGAGVATALTLCLLLSGAIFHRIAMPIVIDRANA
jgi:lipopolysaccharide transport system permease protein